MNDLRPWATHFRRRASLAAVAGIALVSLAAGAVSATQWTQRFQTPTHEIITVLSAPSDSTCWFITNFDRLYKTANSGQNWSVINAPVFIPAGLFVVDDLLAFKTGTATVYRTVNGGVSWTPVFSGTGSTIPEVWMVNRTLGFLAFGGTLYRTTNGGASFSAAGVTQPPGAIINSSGKGTLWVLGNRLWVALANSGVASSPELGATWELPLNQGLTITSTPGIAFANAALGLAIRHGSPFVYVTTDGGGHWTATDNSLGFNQDVVAFGPDLWYIPNPADHFTIRHSADAGATWETQFSDPAGFEVLTRSRRGYALWAGTTFGVVYTYRADQVAATDPPVASLAPLVVFPNPAHDELRLRWSGAEATADAPARYRIFSLDGALVAQGVLDSEAIGTRALPAGCYLLETRAPGTGARSVARWVKR
jgi:photosystem II stability/assembly factor-like uncharacterized protein